MKHVVRIISLIVLIVPIGLLSVFANTSQELSAQSIGSNCVQFNNIGNLEPGEKVEFTDINADGDPITIEVECIKKSPTIPGDASPAKTHKVKASTGIISCSFYMKVKDNKVTKVYNDWIMVLGGTYSNESLSKTSTTGKLTFKVTAPQGIAAAKCWLQGKVTGKSNNIKVSYQL